MPRPNDHPDVLRYRYSNGLCPDVYQVSCPTFAAVSVLLMSMEVEAALKT